MDFILMLLLFGGLFGGCQHIYKTNKKNRLKKRLEVSLVFSDNSTNQKKDDSPIERLLRKSSKGFVLAAMLDKNILFNGLVIIFVCLIIQVLELLNVLVLSKTTKILLILVLVTMVLLVPKKIKRIIVDSRVKRISDDLPFIIDMMAVCVKSGMTIENTIRYLSANTAVINPDISVLFMRIIIKMDVSGMYEALEMLRQEVPSQEVRMLSSTLQQSIQFGSSIYNVLLDLSAEMREIQLLTIDEKVSSLAAKMSLPMIVFIMFPILALIGGPGFIRMIALWSV